MTRFRYFLRASCAAVLIGGTLIAAGPTRSQSNQSGLSPQREAKLRDADEIVDSVMNRVHKTYDFEPIIIGLFAPDASKALHEQLKAGTSTVSDHDLLRAYISTLTILYVGELWRASLAMNGVDVETENYPDNLPSDLKATYRELEKMDSRAQAGRPQRRM